MKLKLPNVILAMLKQRGGVVDNNLRATRAQLINTCNEHGYTPHTSVIAFEAAFGGLLIPDGPKMKKNEPHWLFGAHACLTSGGHTAPRGGSKARKLVPVVYSPNDNIYYLDHKGRAYAEDTIEDLKASYYAEDKTSLVCRIILDDALFSRNETSFDLPGLQGDALSERLSLKLIREASGKDRRFFSDAKGTVLVVEDIKAKTTRFAGATKKQLKLVERPVVSNTITELNLGIQRLTKLPESIWSETQLEELDISFNNITELPPEIGQLKALRKLSLRGCPLKTLPEELANAKNITSLILTECPDLDVDAALLVIARLPKLKDLSLPLSRSLTSLASLAHLPLTSLFLGGHSVKLPHRLPAGLGLLKKLKDLRIDYADEVAELPEAPEDLKALRLIFSKRFTDDDIRQSALRQPKVLYLQAYAKTL